MANTMDKLRELAERLREPRTLSQFVGVHDMATALVVERGQIADELDAILRATSEARVVPGVVRVCPECDIAGCRHLRAAKAQGDAGAGDALRAEMSEFIRAGVSADTQTLQSWRATLAATATSKGDAGAVGELTRNVEDMRRRWMKLVVDLRIGDQLDGDFDILQEVIDHLRYERRRATFESALAASATPRTPPAGDDKAEGREAVDLARWKHARTLIGYVMGYCRATELRTLSSDAIAALRELHALLNTPPAGDGARVTQTMMRAFWECVDRMGGNCDLDDDTLKSCLQAALAARDAQETK